MGKEILTRVVGALGKLHGKYVSIKRSRKNFPLLRKFDEISYEFGHKPGISSNSNVNDINEFSRSLLDKEKAS